MNYFINSFKFPNQPDFDYDIELLREKYGYDYYLPESILEDLLNLSVYYAFERSINNGLMIKQTNLDFINLYKSLDFSVHEGESYIDTAFNILKYLASNYNLRKLDNNDLEYIVDEHDIYCNFKEELKEVDHVYFDNKIDPKIYNEIIVLTNKLKDSLKEITNNSKLKVKKFIDNKSKVFKSKKSNIVQPTFKSKLALNTLKIKDENPDKTKLVVIQDMSFSMGKDSNLKIYKPLQRLLYDIDIDIDYYKTINHKILSFELYDKESKLNCFKDKNYYVGKLNNNKVKEIIDRYSETNIILCTDGLDFIKNNLNLGSNKLFAITTNFNKNLKNLCEKSGGKNIIL